MQMIDGFATIKSLGVVNGSAAVKLGVINKSGVVEDLDMSCNELD